MTMTDAAKLDNPVWYSLSEQHRHFAMEYEHIKFYHPDYCPFGGFQPPGDISGAMADYSLLADNFFIVGERPPVADSLKLKNELVCLQMIAGNKAGAAITEDIVELGEEYRDALFQLVNLVQPGYFKKSTCLLGNYYGIFKNNQLVAVTGERMKMDSYTEVSAVVTHPAHTGKGYAKQLVAHTMNHIFDQNKTPYLHVAENNAGPIRLYEKLGFKTRRKISFWNIIK